jgi:hypothetical protein
VIDPVGLDITVRACKRFIGNKRIDICYLTAGRAELQSRRATKGYSIAFVIAAFPQLLLVN